MPQKPSSASLSDRDASLISIDEAANIHVREGVGYWRSLCGQRRFPARGDLTLRGMARFLSFTVIASVIEGGADFEYRYVGDAQLQAFGVSFKGVRLTQIEDVLPGMGRVLRDVYERSRCAGLPFIVRGRVEYDLPGSDMRYHETAFLPLGATDDAVDHLLMVGVHVPTAFWEIPKDKVTSAAQHLVQAGR
jgi:hypothetical protein